MSSGFHNQHARKIGVVQFVSVALFAVVSLWFGAWYPTAQSAIESVERKIPTFLDVCLKNLEFSSPVLWALILTLLAIWSGVATVASLSRLKDLEAKELTFKAREAAFKREQEEHSETQRYYYESITDNIMHVICGKIPNFDESCRASIYRVDSEAKKFRLVYRFSKIQRYSMKGRYSLPLDEGFLCAAYSDGDSLCMDKLPEKSAGKNAYYKAVAAFLKRYGTSIPQATLNGLTMASRCYYAYSIRDQSSNTKFAILILESLEPARFDPAVVDTVLTGNMQNIQHYVRHIAHLDSKLNPYGASV